MPQQGRQVRCLGQLGHLHRVLHNVALRPEGQVAPAVFVNGDNAVVDARAQALVELHLAPAETPAVGEFPEIQESEILRFLQLVNPLSRKEHGGNVGFPELDARHGVRVERRVRHGLEDVLELPGRLHGYAPLWKMILSTEPSPYHELARRETSAQWKSAPARRRLATVSGPEPDLGFFIAPQATTN